MAQQYSFAGATLTIPQAAVSYTVQTANSGLATNGVLMLVGEADAGPRFDVETSLQDNSFGPDQFAAVKAKYGSGNLVDAFLQACSASSDPNITNSFQRAILVKTNAAMKATSPLTILGGGSYLTSSGLALSLADKSYGKDGNLIYYTVASKTTETVPTTGAFTFLLPIAATDISFRVNGGAASPLTLGVLSTPAANVTAINGLAGGFTASGGVSRALLGSVTGSLQIAIVSGNAISITYTGGTFAVAPTAGDTLYIPSTATNIKGGSNQNCGSYVVTTGSTTSVIFATKLMDASGTPGTLTPPVAIGPGLVVGTTDVQGWSPVTIAVNAANPLQGAGKALEINELTTATDRLSNLCYALSTTKSTFVSKLAAPTVITSATEYAATLNVTRQKDGISESLSAGGEVALKIGYTGTTASLTITSTGLSTTVVGGAGASISSIALKDFPTLADLASFLNAQPGYTCSLGSAILGQLPSTALDDVSVNICTSLAAQPGRVKIDGYRFANQVNSNSVLVQLQDSTATLNAAAAGLPQPIAVSTYLAGGTKGTTSDADVLAALTALQACRGNFVVPLFSRDATADIAEGLTESGSTYTIDAINANTKAHVIAMSSVKIKRHRQAFLSKKDTFINDKAAASNTAHHRCFYSFMDVRNPDSTGAIKQFQPWAGSVNAAAMQAGGFYKSIVNKFANVVGALQAAKDFSDQVDSQLEEALIAGLCPMKRAETGGYYWVSDQTTYGKDSNFVYNSVQAVYAADIIALSTAQRFERAFVGASLADVSAGMALAFLEVVLGDFRALKLITASDDAPKGFKSASIKISGTAMVVSFEVKLAGTLYFVPINFLVSQVVQSA